MKHLVLGTAGHIDHGKTRLVKALTGIDTDTLDEEKQRGISINLGYAHFDLPGGTRLGVIDVPGHMRFIKTMLSGVAGIDFVLLVVAADDSVMPQTREHFDILRLLSVRAGIVVITKTDLADPETVNLVADEIAEMVAGSFLEKAPVIPVSAETGDGLAKLKEAIEKLALSLPERPEGALFRMPVDRSFSAAGFGTVATGTVFSGAIAPGDKVAVLPGNLIAEIRGVQVHHKNAAKAHYGQRAALNIAGVSVEQAARGKTLCAPGYFSPTLMVDVSYLLLNGTRALRNGEPVKFHLATSELNGRFYPLPAQGLAQIRFSDPLVTVRGDRFILRNAAATHTLGGGEILDVHPLKHKRVKNALPETLATLLEPELAERILLELSKSPVALSLSELCVRLSAKRRSISDALDRLDGSDKAVIFSTPSEIFGLHGSRFDAFSRALAEKAELYHAGHPLLETGLPLSEVRHAALQLFPESALNLLLPQCIGRLIKSGRFQDRDKTIALSDWRAHGTKTDENLMGDLLAAFESGGFAPPSMEDVMKRFHGTNSRNALEALLKSNRLIRVGEYLFAETVLEKGRNLIRAYLETRKEAPVSELRQVLNTSRKFAIPLLNRYESDGFLVRLGDLRRLA